MNPNKALKSINYCNDISAEDWNSMTETVFRKYFREKESFISNIEILRTELINYIRFCRNDKYMFLFEWIFGQFQNSIIDNEDLAVQKISDVFNELANTDLKWMTNVITQPDFTHFSERDKIYNYFKIIDDILEGCFKPRFKLLYNFVYYNHFKTFADLSNIDFGQLMRDFEQLENVIYKNFLIDQEVAISISQWRNISAHKSYQIEKDTIVVTYGKKKVKTEILTYKQFYNVLEWIIQIYRVLRLSQVLIELNFINKIVKNIEGVYTIDIRMESSLMHLVHNMQVVGFEFITTEVSEKVFIAVFNNKANSELPSSIIHASQCLDQLACAIYDDRFVKEKFDSVMVKLIDAEKQVEASASINIEMALKKVTSEIDLDTFIDSIIFTI